MAHVKILLSPSRQINGFQLREWQYVYQHKILFPTSSESLGTDMHFLRQTGWRLEKGATDCDTNDWRQKRQQRVFRMQVCSITKTTPTAAISFLTTDTLAWLPVQLHLSSMTTPTPLTSKSSGMWSSLPASAGEPVNKLMMMMMMHTSSDVLTLLKKTIFCEGGKEMAVGIPTKMCLEHVLKLCIYALYCEDCLATNQ